MKMMRYQVMGYTIIYDPATEQDVRHEAPATIETVWSAQAEALARQVALGAVEIYDDGEDIDAHAAEEIETRVSNLEHASAEMTETIEIILLGVTGDE